MRFRPGVPVIIGCVLLSACIDAEQPAAVDPSAGVTLAEEEGGEDGPPLAGLNATELAQFAAGKVVFARVFDEDSGLGPLFNADACGECHEEPGLGSAGDEVENHFSSEAPPAPCDLMTAVGGNVLQTFTTPRLFNATGLQSEPETAQPHFKGRRTTPDLLGFGLIDAITDAEILSRADPNDANHDGISGRAHITPAGVGRFGRKAGERSLDAFNAGAFLLEMGVTNPPNPHEESVGGAALPAGVDLTPEPELSQTELDLANAFVRFLAPPEQLPMTQQANAGKNVFSAVGCNSCHTPNMKTGPSPVRALSKVNVHIFSDLLLHDIGTGDNGTDICIGNATSKEFRTEPLMGLRDNPAFLHDGRATTIEQAILFHGGEATNVRNNYNALNASQKKALLAYLNTI